MAAKNPTVWNPNPNATTNLYPYDSASHTYDSATDTYDGIVSGESFYEPQNPVDWSDVTKNATTWSEVNAS